MKLSSYLEGTVSNLTPLYGKCESQNIVKALRMDLQILKSYAINDLLNENDLQFLDKVLDDLKSYKPVQYITGLAHFYGYKFKVNSNVLIPRPETEELVYQCIESNKLRSPKILDIGTGSGCIAISVKNKITDAEITAIDLSQEALVIAKENAAYYKQEIDFYKFDFLDEDSWSRLKVFDIILSNPPYIDKIEKERMGVSVVKYEPDMALFTDLDPQIFYKKIALFVEKHLAVDGVCLLELNEFRAEESYDIFDDNWNCEIINDLQNKPRILKVKR